MSFNELKAREIVDVGAIFFLFVAAWVLAHFGTNPANFPLFLLAVVMVFIDLCLTRYWQFKTYWGK